MTALDNFAQSSRGRPFLQLPPGDQDDVLVACERGDSVKGVSSSVIRSAVAGRRALVVENPYLTVEADVTPALAGENYSVLCAPVLDPLRDGVRAVMYFQATGQSYQASDAVWIEGYAAAVGQAVQFERLGYFCADPDSTPGRPVFKAM